MTARIILALLIASLLNSTAGAATIYVDASAPVGQTGTSWADAFHYLHQALAVADSADAVWVAAGTYSQPNESIRSDTFLIPTHGRLLGGFNGTETSESQRDPAVNVTILDGEYPDSPLVMEHSFHVVTMETASTLDGFTIRGGVADEYPSLHGAGAWVVGPDAIVRNCRFEQNSAGQTNSSSGRGAAIACEAGALGLIVEDSWFEDNNVYGFASAGGAIYDENFQSNEIRRCTFIQNSSESMGGALSNSALIEDCYFELNTAVGRGGAVRMVGLVRRCEFVENSSLSNGGAIIYVNYIYDSVFLRNSAAYGGALFGPCQASNSRFEGNTAEFDGGAYTATGSTVSLPARFDSCLFVGNHAGTRGGAIWGYFPIPSEPGGGLINCSVVNNTAGTMVGGVARLDKIQNSIVWGNVALSSPNLEESSFSMPISYSLIEGCGGSGVGWNVALGIDTGANIDANPGFVDPNANDVRIGPTSIAADAGNDAFVTTATDAVGEPRIQDAAVDMGALESSCSGGTIVHVDASSAGTDDGSSWTDAYDTLREGIALACDHVDEIWVAAGTYTPPANPKLSFAMRSNLALLGGFSGTGASRDWVSNPTILSGEIGAPVPRGNTEHVVSCEDADSTAVLDGFIIQDGYADYPAYDVYGAGLLIDGGNPQIRNVVFRQNQGRYGAAIAVRNGAAPEFVNIVAHDNDAPNQGSFAYVADSSPVFVNATVAGNDATTSAITHSGSGSTSFINGILWGNGTAFAYSGSPPLIHHSLVEGSGGSGGSWNTAFGTDLGSNVDADPLFVDLLNRDLHVWAQSPAIDAGDGSANPLLVDAAGNPRVVGSIDIGAYESDVLVAAPAVLQRSRLATSPNPFNPIVRINFALAQPGHANLHIVDVSGRVVRDLFGGPVDTSLELVWDGRDSHGRSVASGVYFAVLKSGDSALTEKMTLLK